MSLLTLLRAKGQIWRNTLTRKARREQLRTLLGTVATIYFGFLLFRGVLGLFQFLAVNLPAAVPYFMTTALSGLIAFALFWGMGTLLLKMFISSDLELLMAAPIPPRAIYLAKLLEGMQGLLFPSIMSLSCIVAYGVVSASDWGYYVLGLVGFICLAMLITAASMSLIMIIVRLLPANRLREIWMLIWTVSIALIWGFWMLTSNRGGNPIQQQLLNNNATLTQTGRILGWSPAGWLTNLLIAWQNGDRIGALGNGALLLGGTMLLVAVGYVIYQRAFYVGWSQLQEQASRKQKRNGVRSRGQLLERLVGFLPVRIRAIAIKEWTILPRDMRQLSVLFFPVVMGAVYVYMTATGDVAQQLPGATVWLTIAIIPLVPLFLAIYHSIGSMAMEHSNFALLRAAPLSAGDLLWAKFWASFVLLGLMAEVMAVVALLILGATPAQLLIGVLVVLLLTAGFVAIGIGASCMSPNFAAQNARRAVDPTAVYFVLFLGAAFWVAQVALLAWLLLQIGPASISALLEQLLLALIPGLEPYLHSLLSLLIIAAADAVVVGVIIWLWQRGRHWIEDWQVTDMV